MMTRIQFSTVLFVLMLGTGMSTGLQAQTVGTKAGTGSVAGSAPPHKPVATTLPAASDDKSSVVTGSGSSGVEPDSGRVGTDTPAAAGVTSRAKVHDDRSTLMGQPKTVPDQPSTSEPRAASPVPPIR